MMTLPSPSQYVVVQIKFQKTCARTLQINESHLAKSKSAKGGRFLKLANIPTIPT